MLAWDDAGEGFIMQVSTPNWAGAGSKQFRRKNGNTLGCLAQDGGKKPQNNVLVSQHFFALKLTKADVVTVVKALRHISIVTAHKPSHNDHQVVNNGGPADIAAAVDELGTISESSGYLDERLSTGVRLIAKSPKLTVPPWQMVSAVLSQKSLKVATWYSTNKIPDTDGRNAPGCWDPRLENPGPVVNVLTGHWSSTRFKLVGGSNHAKLGVSTSGNLAIFGDMNQEGSLSGPKCDVRQNPRGGMFYVLEDNTMADALRHMFLPQ